MGRTACAVARETKNRPVVPRGGALAGRDRIPAPPHSPYLPLRRRMQRRNPPYRMARPYAAPSATPLQITSPHPGPLAGDPPRRDLLFDGLLPRHLFAQPRRRRSAPPGRSRRRALGGRRLAAHRGAHCPPGRDAGPGLRRPRQRAADRTAARFPFSGRFFYFDRKFTEKVPDLKLL